MKYGATTKRRGIQALLAAIKCANSYKAGTDS